MRNDRRCPSRNANWRITREHTPPVILGRGRAGEGNTVRARGRCAKVLDSVSGARRDGDRDGDLGEGGVGKGRYKCQWASGPLVGANLGGSGMDLQPFQLHPDHGPAGIWHYSVLYVHYSWIRRCAVGALHCQCRPISSSHCAEFRFGVSNWTNRLRAESAGPKRATRPPVSSQARQSRRQGAGVMGYTDRTATHTWTFHSCN